MPEIDFMTLCKHDTLKLFGLPAFVLANDTAFRATGKLLTKCLQTHKQYALLTKTMSTTDSNSTLSMHLIFNQLSQQLPSTRLFFVQTDTSNKISSRIEHRVRRCWSRRVA